MGLAIDSVLALVLHGKAVQWASPPKLPNSDFLRSWILNGLTNTSGKELGMVINLQADWKDALNDGLHHVNRV